MPSSCRYGPFQAMIAAYARSQHVTASSFQSFLADRDIVVSLSLVERWLSGRDLMSVDVAVLLVQHAGGWLEHLVQALVGGFVPVPPPPAAPALPLRRAA